MTYVGPSLLDFLGPQSPLGVEGPAPRDWRPEAPPSLAGISDIILNVETNGLEWWNGARPIGITVGTPYGDLMQFLPFGFKGQNLDEAVVKEWARRELRNKHILNANTRFDVHMLREWGVDLVEQGCTFGDIQHYAALCDDHRMRSGLDTLATDLLGGIRIPRVDEKRMAEYDAYQVQARAVYQVELVAALRDVFWPQLDREGLHEVRALEDAVIPVVCEMEKNAAPIDLELLEIYTRESQQEYEFLIWQIRQEAGFPFDDSAESWVQLFEKYQIPLSYLESGKPTFKDTILARIDHPVIKKARYAAQLDSLRSKIFKPYNDPRVVHEGRLRCEFHQLRSDDGGTVSGRFSAPYIQQVPNDDNHRETFGVKYNPRKLYKPGSGLFLSADAAQIEYRIFSHFANNARVLQAYKDKPDLSFHKMMFGHISPFIPNLSYPGMKNFNFMRIYGGGLVKTAVMMGQITEEEGEIIRNAKTSRTDTRLTLARDVEQIYNKELPEAAPLTRLAMHLAMPECNQYCQKTDRLHRTHKHRGYVTTLKGRRARWTNFYKIHKALNSIIQGSAADIMKMKLVELFNARKTLGLTLRATNHDEAIADVPDVETAAKVETMLNEQSIALKVPVLWEVGTGANWSEAKA